MGRETLDTAADVASAPGGGEPTFDADTFGRALEDTYEDGGAVSNLPQVVELSNGHIAVGRLGRYFENEEELGTLDRWAVQWAKGRILDVGAGAGRHALILQQKGGDVTALDPSPRAIDVCRRRGVNNAVCADIATLSAEVTAGREAPYDTLLLLGNNIGLSGSREEAPSFWRMLREITVDGGQLVGSCRDPYATKEEYDLAYMAANLGAGRLGGQMTMRVRHKHYAGPWFNYLFCTAEELEALIVDSGWEITSTAFEGDGYAVRMKAV